MSNTDKTGLLKLKDWRPLSLLNQDYKIISKLDSDRIKIALPKMINFDQSGFLKGRYIGQNNHGPNAFYNRGKYISPNNCSWFWKGIWYFRMDIYESIFGKVSFPLTHETMGQNTIYWYKKLRNQQRLELWILPPRKRGEPEMPTFPIYVYPLCRNISPTSTKLYKDRRNKDWRERIQD